MAWEGLRFVIEALPGLFFFFFFFFFFFERGGGGGVRGRGWYHDHYYLNMTASMSYK